MGPRTVVAYRTSKHVRIALGGLVAAVLALGVAIVFVVMLLMDLKAARDHEAAERQQAIDRTFCNVLAQLPANSPPLDRIRAELHCTERGLTPDQMKALATTGGSP